MPETNTNVWGFKENWRSQCSYINHKRVLKYWIHIRNKPDADGSISHFMNILVPISPVVGNFTIFLEGCCYFQDCSKTNTTPVSAVPWRKWQHICLLSPASEYHLLNEKMNKNICYPTSVICIPYMIFLFEEAKENSEWGKRLGHIGTHTIV